MEEVSRATKINLLFLQALEDNRFDWLPGGMFPRAMVRVYARAVGASEREAVAVYDAQFPPPPPAPPEPVRRSRAPFFAIGAAVVLIAIAAAATVIVWRNSTVAVVRQSPAPAALSVEPLSALQAPLQNASVHTASSLDAPSPTPSSAGPSGLDLQIEVLEECWLSLTADGTIVDRRLLKKGDAFTYHADSSFEAIVGNAAGLKFVINGEVWDNLGDGSHVKRIRIDKDEGKVRLTT